MAFILKSTARPLVANVVNNNAVLLSSARGIIWFGKKDIRMPKDFDHATGEERLVNVAKTQGIPDPFDMAEQVRGPGTKDNPNIIQSFEESRLIGCKCEEESSTIRYMWLNLNEPKRCECGFWFKAVPARKFWEEFAGK